MRIRTASLAAALFALTGCGLIYTVPSVHDGEPFATAYGTNFDVRVVRLDHETAQAANLEPYVPPRLPLAFQPDAMASMAEAETAASGLPAPAAQPRMAATRLPPPGEPEPYRIGVADVLLLSVQEPVTLEELPGLISAQAKRQGYIVQEDGAIGIPDAGRVRVAGLTLRDAEAAIFETLVNAGIDPSFSLEIAEFNSQRVSVGGLVTAPTLVPITLTPLHLNEAIQLAGGIAAPDPTSTVIQLSRDGSTYRIPLERFLDDARARQIVLRDGDAIHVGSQHQAAQAQLWIYDEARQRAVDQRQVFRERLELGAVEQPFAYLAGEVRQPGRVALPFERSFNLADVLFDDGGINIERGDYAEIYVLRAASEPELYGALTAYNLNAENAVNLAVATQFEIRPNDVVFVAEQPVTSWNRVISQILPQLLLSLPDRLSKP